MHYPLCVLKLIETLQLPKLTEWFEVYDFCMKCLSYVVTGHIIDIGGMGAFFGGTFSEKKAFFFFLLASPKQLSFLTISNENIFLKTQCTRLGLE